jgi:SAM-dependent methyltransferase
MERSDPEFLRRQADHFADAEAERFRWTTAAPGFAESEDLLLAPLVADVASPCLEIGCGEGNNLLRLSRRARCVGIDRFARKLAFAASELPRVAFAAADAAALPFRDGAFASVVVRDLLHHVPRPERVLAEAVRVLARGGRLFVLEPNGRNPLVGLHARLVPAELGALRSSPESLTSLLAGLPLAGVEVATRQPLPLRRLLLHYRFGAPALGRSRVARGLLAAVDSAAARLLPASRWCYVLLSARRA